MVSFLNLIFIQFICITIFILKTRNTDSQVTYWIAMSDYDLETANAMLLTGRYLYVGFMCHQTIEKILKAYWTNCLMEVPLKIHSLSRLAERTGLDKQLSEEQLDFIDKLEPLNIEARYPSYKERLMKSLTKENTVLNF